MFDFITEVFDFKYKINSLTFIPGYILNLHLPHLRHVAQHCEDDEPRHEAGQTVHQTGHDGVTVEEEILTLFKDMQPNNCHSNSSLNQIFHFYQRHCPNVLLP